MFEITVEDTFNSAHQLKGYQGACEKLHGHTWKVAVTVTGENLDQNGMLADFKVLKNKLEKILKNLDHNFLNDLPEFKNLNPSAENIAKFIFKKFNDPKVKCVKVWESEKSSATYYA